jgi:hypothetical protein
VNLADDRVDPNAENDLKPWIESVKQRLARGELTHLGPMPVGNDLPNLPGELFVRIMVADYEHYDDLSPERRRAAETIAQRVALIKELCRLRETIG